MTKQEAVKQQGLEHETFDYALPQNWVDEVSKHLPEHLKNQIVNNFVWLYDDYSAARIFGRPASLSPGGNEILSHILNRQGLFLEARYWKSPDTNAPRCDECEKDPICETPPCKKEAKADGIPDLSDEDIKLLLMKVIDKSHNDPVWMNKILDLALTWGNDCLCIILDYYHLPHPPSDWKQIKPWMQQIHPRLKELAHEPKQ